MKPHFKTLAIAILAALIGGCMPALAAVPLRWAVETSRAQPASFDVYRGETLHLAADMTSYGRPLEMAGAVALYYQTNGMAGAWWSVPATVASNRIEAVLAPTNYPGDAQTLNCFLGGPATSYRAAFRLRVLGAPGPAPNALALPVRSIDFSQVEVANAPWIPTAGGVADDLRVTGTLYFGPPPPLHVQGAAGQYIEAYSGRLWMRNPDGRPVYLLNDGNFPGYLYDDFGLDIFDLAENVGEIADIAQSVTNLSNTVNAWQTYWDGDDVRLTVTNYYGSLEIPHLYLEQKVSEGGTNYFKRVWDETTRHDAIIERVRALETNVAEKADRAWGFYDSHTGVYAPDGFTSISSPNVIVAPGMAYQQTVSATGNAIWVLTCNEPTMLSGVASNGFLRVSDGEGRALFEIVKGDKRTVGATASGISVDGFWATLVYNVASATPPDLQYCTDLASGEWHNVATGASLGNVPKASWSGGSGSWTASVHLSGYDPMPSPPARMFFKATYTAGGETYIRNAAPVSVEGGILCTDGIHKVRPVYSNGAVTWQVVQ